MRRPFSPPLLVLPLVACGTPAVGADVAHVEVVQAREADGAAPPRVVVGAAAAGGQTLAFDLTLRWNCPTGSSGEQLFVSVADTAWLDAAGTAPSRTVRLDVPLDQLGWLLPPACAGVARQRGPDEVDGEGRQLFRLHAGAAAHAALLCTGADGAQSGAGATTALDVWLSCAAGGR